MTTGKFRISHGALARYLLLQRALLPALLIAGGAVAMGIMAAALDIRWLAGTLFLLFAVLPPLLALIYYSTALRPLYAFNILSHQLEPDDEGVRVSLYPAAPPKEDSDDEAEKVPEVKKMLIPYDMLGRMLADGSSVIFPLGKRGREGAMIISEAAFADAGDFKTFIRALGQRMAQNGAGETTKIQEDYENT